MNLILIENLTRNFMVCGQCLIQSLRGGAFARESVYLLILKEMNDYFNNEFDRNVRGLVRVKRF